MSATTQTRGEALRELGRRAAETAQARVPGAPALVEALERERLSGAGLLAGGIAYRIFLWLVPFGLVVAAVASVWADIDAQGLESTAEDFGLSGAAAASARTAFESGKHSRWYLLGAGLVLMLWFGASAVRSLRVTHQIAWADRGPKPKRVLRASLVFNGTVIGVAVLGLGAPWIRHAAGTGAGLGATLGMAVVYVLAAAFAISLLPHRNVPFRALLPGAVLVMVGMQLVHLLVVLYLAPKLQRAPALYGSLGAAAVLLLWLYVIARLLVSAAFLNATLWDRGIRSPHDRQRHGSLGALQARARRTGV